MPDPKKVSDDRKSNVFDYIKWRGDVPFSVDPFNEVDNVILSLVAYAPLKGIVPGAGETRSDVLPAGAPGLAASISIKEASTLFWQRDMASVMNTDNPAIGYSPQLLKALASSERFSQIRMSAYSEETDKEDAYQFAAVTFTIPDNTHYVAFRGTDDTWIGWKEDFNLAYMKGTKGQKLAAEYLNGNFRGKMLRLRVGGHSKGGNFAVYAAMHADEDVRKRIIQIYSNDGPGFLESITDSPEYKAILPKLEKYVPEESMIGILMDTDKDSYLIKSDASGVMQHDPFSWQISGNRIVRAEKRSESSIFFEKTINNWVNSLDEHSREVFIEALFDSVESTGATKVSEFLDDPVAAYNAIVKTVKELSHEDQATCLLVLKKLGESGTNQVVESLLGKFESLMKNL